MTKKTIGLFLASLAVWVWLAGISPEEIGLGVIISLLVAVLFGESSAYTFDLKWFIGLLLFIVLYIPIFLWELIKSNVDVMLRVINPKLPINPGFVRVPTGLKGDVAQLILANSITLTPGTITLEVDDSVLYVHWIDVKKEDHMPLWSMVSEPFESLLRRVFK